MDAKRSREHFRAAIAAARPQERLQLRRMAEASLALAERRAGDLKVAAEKLGQTPPSNRQLFMLQLMGYIAPPPGSSIIRRVGGVLLLIAIIVGLLALGWGIVQLVALPFGGHRRRRLDLLGLPARGGRDRRARGLGRRRQKRARAKARPSSARTCSAARPASCTSHSAGAGRSTDVTTVALPPFWSLVEAHGDELLAHARRLAGDQHAEDVVQDALLRALRAYPRLRHADHLRAWLYRVTTTAAIDAAPRAPARAPDRRRAGRRHRTTPTTRAPSRR